MIKSNELRVGNAILNRNGFRMCVTAIFKDTVYLDFEGNEGDVWEEDCKDLKTIPVNKDLLLKYGFEKDVATEEYVSGECFRKKDVTVNAKTKEVYNGIFTQKIKSLHVLQNWWFAMYGKEL